MCGEGAHCRHIDGIGTFSSLGIDGIEYDVLPLRIWCVMDDFSDHSRAVVFQGSSLSKFFYFASQSLYTKAWHLSSFVAYPKSDL